MTSIYHWLGLFCFVFTTSAAHAFSNDRCGNLFPKSDGAHPPYYSPVYVTTMIPSTTSYISSIGSCSMYGESSSSGFRKAFLDNSLVPLKVDIARGKGEYINALAELSGCPEDQFSVFAATLHGQVTTLFSEPSSILTKIDNAILATPDLRQSCHFIN